MDEIFARIIAHLMGDGYINERYLRYNNKDKFLLTQFKRCMVEAFGENIHFIEGKVNSGTSFVQVQNKSIIGRILTAGKSFKSGDIKLPESIATGGDCVKKAFLQALFDDEGSIGLRVHRATGEIKRDVHLDLKSYEMIEQMRTLLQEEFEIGCNKIGENTKLWNGKKYRTFVLRITGRENLQCFQDQIGFSAPVKIEKLDELLLSYKRPLLRES